MNTHEFRVLLAHGFETWCGLTQLWGDCSEGRVVAQHPHQNPTCTTCAEKKAWWKL